MVDLLYRGSGLFLISLKKTLGNHLSTVLMNKRFRLTVYDSFLPLESRSIARRLHRKRRKQGSSPARPGLWKYGVLMFLPSGDRESLRS
jgi:hypothetical protein